jgi:hydrogenase expression/formation protein HypE
LNRGQNRTGRKLRPGKVPIDVLENTVLRLTGFEGAGVSTPAAAGLDFAAVKAGNGYIVISADPVTGVEEKIGVHAVNVSANDVATSGNRPRFAESVVLLPEGSRTGYLRAIAGQIHSTAKHLGISVVGGHTEVTPGLRNPIVTVTAFSFVRNYVSARDAEEGDVLMMTKTAGIEGTAAIAGAIRSWSDVSARTIINARRFVERMSIVEEAVAGYETGAVHAMHDCTEGGLVGAVFEMALASELGVVLNEDAVPVAPETRELCEAASIDPLRLIGSGSLLLAVKKGEEDRVARALKKFCVVTSVGEFTGGRRVVASDAGRERVVESAPEDELWRLLGRPR